MNSHEEGMEDFEKEMAKMNKIEQLKEILKRLMEFKRKGGEAGIDQKIGEVQLELRRHLREEIDTEESKVTEQEEDEIKKNSLEGGKVEIEADKWNNIVGEGIAYS